MSHPCAVPACGRYVATERLMCPPHWRLVPVLLQAAVYATWANRKAALGGPHYREAVEGHEAAVRHAVAALGATR
jgi:hypothetical protein